MSTPGKVGSQALRQVNRSVLLDIIRSEDRISRSELARRSGLTKPTVSAIVESLLKEEVVREVGFSGSVSAGGRPARLLEFNAECAAYLGIEFGVEGTRIAIADGRGNIRSISPAKAPAGDPDALMRELPETVRQALKTARVPKARVQSVGATVPGLVDQKTGTCRLAPNLGWRDFPLRQAVERSLRWPAVVTNITQASAIAEGRLGAARGVDSYVWVYLGSGVGCGIILNGRTFTGTRGFAGEIGHCRISDEDVVCGCGATGHLEAFVSSQAVVRIARYAALETPDSALASKGPELDVKGVIEVAKEGDVTARAVLARVGDNVGKGVAYLANLLDPELFVLGGTVSVAGTLLTEPVQEALNRYAMVGESAKVVPSTLGENAGLVGAVLLAMDRAVRSYRMVAAGVGPDAHAEHSGADED